MVLSLAPDSQIIELLFRRDETVFEKITIKYKALYKSVLKRFLNDTEDVNECENDVLLAVWSSIPPNRPDNLAAYIAKLARNIGINKYKYNLRDKRNAECSTALDELKDCIPDKTTSNVIVDNEKSEELNVIVSDFVKSLDKESRILFIRRYFYLETVQELAQRYKMSENAVSVKLFRARKKLHKILEKEGLSL